MQQSRKRSETSVDPAGWPLFGAPSIDLTELHDAVLAQAAATPAEDAAE